MEQAIEMHRSCARTARSRPSARVRAARRAGAALALGLVVTAEARQVSFADEAIARGVNYAIPAGASSFAGFGVGLADLDADGDLDLVGTGGAGNRIGVFENDGSGHFTDRSLTCGLPPLPAVMNVAATDLNGDGLPELVFTGYQRAPALFKNLGGLQFSDQSAASGITIVSITAGIASGDIDNDGDVDLILPHYAFPIPALVNVRNQVWRNDGNLKFTEVAAQYGMNLKAYSLMPVLFDPDEDGDLDLYLSNDRGHLGPGLMNRYYRHDGSNFTEIGEANGTGLPFFSMGVAVGDLDGDLLTDLYCTNIDSSSPPLFGDFPLFMATPSGAYLQKQALWGVAHYGVGWACIFFDADNEGFRDLFVANQTAPNCLYRNGGLPPMVKITDAAGLGGPIGACYGAAVGDVDGDRRLDLVINPFGENLRLYMNQSPVLSAVLLHIVGIGADTAALGATVRVTAGGKTQLGHVLQGGNGYLGQNGLDLHFGLGSSPMINTMTVRWPGLGGMRTLANYPANQRWTIYPVSRLGDLDGDGTVTGAELTELSAWCGSPVAPGLEIFDMDGDGQIGAQDLALARLRLTGARGDFDDDGHVNGADLGALLSEWGGSCSVADLDDSGLVDGDDLGTLLGSWTG